MLFADVASGPTASGPLMAIGVIAVVVGVALGVLSVVRSQQGNSMKPLWIAGIVVGLAGFALFFVGILTRPAPYSRPLPPTTSTETTIRRTTTTK